MDRQMIAARTLGHVQIGDVVVFHYKGEQLIKRVQAKAWDKVVLFRAGAGSDRDYVARGQESAFNKALSIHPDWITEKYIVPIGYVFVTGDNDLFSVDSRDFGPIPLSSIEAILPPVKNKGSNGYFSL